jgi:hypothetical protein
MPGLQQGKVSMDEKHSGGLLAPGARVALMAKAGHSDMKTTRIYLHLGAPCSAMRQRRLKAGSSARLRTTDEPLKTVATR